MKVIVLTIFVISCTSVFGYNLQSTIYEDFPNQCTNDVDVPSFIRIGKKYLYIEASEKLSWFGAAHFCHSLNATLATIETADDMHFLSQHLVSKGYTKDHWFWTAGNDLTTEGQFQWLSTGKTMVYTKWSSGQPDNAGGHENCVHLWLREADFYMNDWQCNQKAHYICEMNTPKTIAITIW